MFKSELAGVLNKYNKESKSGTPDFILAKFLSKCLAAYNAAVCERDKSCTLRMPNTKIELKRRK